MTNELINCIGCNALVASTGPVPDHPNTSPGCYTLFSEVLGREYSDYRYTRVHNMTVDAYSLQHIGEPAPKSIKSVAVHLISLYLQFEQDYNNMQAARIKQQAARHSDRFVWLDPPAHHPTLTIIDIHAATSPEDHIASVQQWARTVWADWAAHHDTIKEWASWS